MGLFMTVLLFVFISNIIFIGLLLVGMLIGTSVKEYLYKRKIRKKYNYTKYDKEWGS
jgi:hypothetical protein